MWDRMLDGDSAAKIAADLGITADEASQTVAAYCKKLRAASSPEPAPRQGPVLRVVGRPPVPRVIRPPESALVMAPLTEGSGPPASFSEAVDRRMCLFLAPADTHPTCEASRKPGSRYCPDHHSRRHTGIKQPIRI